MDEWIELLCEKMDGRGITQRNNANNHGDKPKASLQPTAIATKSSSKICQTPFPVTSSTASLAVKVNGFQLSPSTSRVHREQHPSYVQKYPASVSQRLNFPVDEPVLRRWLFSTRALRSASPTNRGEVHSFAPPICCMNFFMIIFFYALRFVHSCKCNLGLMMSVILSIACRQCFIY